MIKIMGIKSKRGLSEIIAYVLLISIAVAISIIVYGWLRSQITTNEGEKCPEEVSLIIKNYTCSFDNSKLELSLQNKGFFTIKGFLVKVNNRTDAEFGVYSLNLDSAGTQGVQINIGESADVSYTTSPELGIIKLVEVQPFILGKKSQVYCKSVTQKINCES